VRWATGFHTDRYRLAMIRPMLMKARAHRQ
jgi:hypothetical protein